MQTIFRSIGVILLGFMVNALLSVLTDFLLESIGVLPDPSKGLFETWAIILVLFYRAVYAILAGFIVASLIGKKAFLHVIILGLVGTVITLVAIANPTFDEKAPLWFGYSLAVMILPMLWLGAKIEANWRVK
jgi:hypothetical protein